MNTHTTLSAESKRVLDAIGHGMRLTIPKQPLNAGPRRAVLARVIVNPAYPKEYQEAEFDVSTAAVSELISSGLIGEIPEHRTNQKSGWRESGLPGDTHRIYACIQ